MLAMFTQLIGTGAVMLVIAALIGGGNFIDRFVGHERSVKGVLCVGVLGGLFGIYGNLAGIPVQGAVVSVRDIGPMLAGLMGGPLGGLIAGAIAGFHRLSMGGITAVACVIATCCIGLACGLLADKYHERLVQGHIALLIGALMETFHLCVVLIVVRPFETALAIVKSIAIPFVGVNALCFALMIAITNYITNQRRMTIEQGRLKSELEVASVIQYSILPAINDDFPNRKEFDIRGYMTPAKNVGGDFYDLFFLNSERSKIAFLIADVSGKGIPAALFMANAKTKLQNCIRDFEDDLATAIQTANNAICYQNEAEMFVTAWIGVLDIQSGGVDYICAGHNPPVVIREEGPEYMRQRSGFVLGGMEGTPYRVQHLDLAPGDTLFLYTDGVTEAENIQHELYGEERLQACLTSLRGQSPQEVIDCVKADVADFVKEADQFDDITMLCLKLAEK